MIKHIPEAVEDIFRKIKNIDPQALLAGGYLRDLDHEVEPKDIDVFIRRDESTFEIFEFLSSYQGKRLEPVRFEHEDSAEHDDTIDFQYQCQVLNLPVFNLLVCKQDVAPIDRFPHFDFGLCQIGYNGQMLWTDAYEKDKADKTFTMMRYRNSFDYEASIARFKRFSLRYPEHKLVIPPNIAERRAAE